MHQMLQSNLDTAVSRTSAQSRELRNQNDNHDLTQGDRAKVMGLYRPLQSTTAAPFKPVPMLHARTITTPLPTRPLRLVFLTVYRLKYRSKYELACEHIVCVSRDPGQP